MKTLKYIFIKVTKIEEKGSKDPLQMTFKYSHPLYRKRLEKSNPNSP